jgi:hypothetical protein
LNYQKAQTPGGAAGKDDIKTASAANWQFVTKAQHPQCGVVSFYLDTQSVVKNGNTITFDMQYIYSTPCNGETRIVNKLEVDLSSRQRRYIETISYDASGKEVARAAMSPWHEITPNSSIDAVINRAMQYAR